MKLVINRCFGGFSPSDDAVMLYAKLKGFRLHRYEYARDANGNLDLHHYVPAKKPSNNDIFGPFYLRNKPKADGTYADDDYFSARDIPRDDPDLVRVVKKLGKKASRKVSNLKVVEIPDGVEYEIDEYDGLETIHEQHRSWS